MADRIELRQCTMADAATLGIVGAATLLDTFAGVLPGAAILGHCARAHTAAAYADLLGRPETSAWLAEVAPGAAPIGYAVLTAPDFPAGMARDGDVELRRIYLLSRFHGAGVGRGLMDRAVGEARRRGASRLLLGVHPDNHKALAFYGKVGFVQVGRRPFRAGPEVFDDPVLALPL